MPKPWVQKVQPVGVKPIFETVGQSATEMSTSTPISFSFCWTSVAVSTLGRRLSVMKVILPPL